MCGGRLGRRTRKRGDRTRFHLHGRLYTVAEIPDHSMPNDRFLDQLGIPDRGINNVLIHRRDGRSPCSEGVNIQFIVLSRRRTRIARDCAVSHRFGVGSSISEIPGNGIGTQIGLPLGGIGLISRDRCDLGRPSGKGITVLRGRGLFGRTAILRGGSKGNHFGGLGPAHLPGNGIGAQIGLPLRRIRLIPRDRCDLGRPADKGIGVLRGRRFGRRAVILRGSAVIEHFGARRSVTEVPGDGVGAQRFLPGCRVGRGSRNGSYFRRPAGKGIAVLRRRRFGRRAAILRVCAVGKRFGSLGSVHVPGNGIGAQVGLPLRRIGRVGRCRNNIRRPAGKGIAILCGRGFGWCALIGRNRSVGDRIGYRIAVSEVPGDLAGKRKRLPLGSVNRVAGNRDNGRRPAGKAIEMRFVVRAFEYPGIGGEFAVGDQSYDRGRTPKVPRDGIHPLFPRKERRERKIGLDRIQGKRRGFPASRMDPPEESIGILLRLIIGKLRGIGDRIAIFHGFSIQFGAVGFIKNNRSLVLVGCRLENGFGKRKRLRSASCGSLRQKSCVVLGKKFFLRGGQFRANRLRAGVGDRIGSARGSRAGVFHRGGRAVQGRINRQFLCRLFNNGGRNRRLDPNVRENGAHRVGVVGICRAQCRLHEVADDLIRVQRKRKGEIYRFKIVEKRLQNIQLGEELLKMRNFFRIFHFHSPLRRGICVNGKNIIVEFSDL